MVKKSILIAIILLVGFEIFIRVSNIPTDTSQNDKSANLISAQNFIYNLPATEVEKDTVIIGSSISRKLVTDSLGKNFYNLAFNAWSSYDGLQIVKLTKKKPACLLIEMNIVGNQHLQEDVVNSLDPISYYPNKTFKSLQLQNQPVGLAIGYLKDKLKARMEEMKKKKRENEELYKLNVKMKKEEFMHTLPDSVFENRLAVLKTLIDEFKAQNIGIVFFEAPFDGELEQTAAVLTTRKYFQRYFPDTAYTYLPMPAVNNFVYSDGLHLNIESAMTYTLFLKNELNSIKNKKLAN